MLGLHLKDKDTQTPQVCHSSIRILSFPGLGMTVLSIQGHGPLVNLETEITISHLSALDCLGQLVSTQHIVQKGSEPQLGRRSPSSAPSPEWQPTTTSALGPWTGSKNLKQWGGCWLLPDLCSQTSLSWDPGLPVTHTTRGSPGTSSLPLGPAVGTCGSGPGAL